MYYDLMAWKNPFVTGIIMFIFTYLCICMDAERAGALLVFILILCLSYGWWERRSGRFRLAYIEKDGSTQEPDGANSSRPFRALAKLKVSVERVGLAVAGGPEVTAAKGLSPPPVIKTPNGKVSVVISYAIQENSFEPEADLVVGCVSNGQPTMADQQTQGLDVDFRLPFAAAAQYMGGDRGNIFRNVVEYEELVNGGMNRSQAVVGTRPWFLYPVLQPIAHKGGGKMEVQPFTSATGAIRLRVFLDTDLHAFEEEYLGQVFIPIRLLVEAMKGANQGGQSGEIAGWFTLGDEIKEASKLLGQEQPPEKGVGAVNIFLRLKLAIPEPGAAPPKKQEIQESQAFEAVLEQDFSAQSG